MNMTNRGEGVILDVERKRYFDANREAFGGGAGDSAGERLDHDPPTIPKYLQDTYYWAYLSPLGVALLDHPIVVWTILWGNYPRLRNAAFSELEAGQKVLQPACVYGNFSPQLAQHLGPQGELEVLDVAPIQVESCRRKLRGFDHARVRLADTAHPGNEVFDAVCCFFLLHELPNDYKHRVVNALLGRVPPGGKVVFVDYHRPHPAHPLKLVTSFVFRHLEPFAFGMWDREIADLADNAGDFDWSKETYFGSLFQKVVARRRPVS